MTTPAITDKLRKELNRGIASEPRASYLLTEVRKIIERDSARSKYSNLKFLFLAKISSVPGMGGSDIALVNISNIWITTET